MKTSSFMGFDLRSIITILIPGFIGLLPIIYFGFEHLKNLSGELLISLCVMGSLFVGTIFDVIALYIELFILDVTNRETKRKEKKEEDKYDPDKDWNNFLTLTYEGHEPIGHRYLRNVLTSMKFQLCTSISLIFVFFQLIYFNEKIPPPNLRIYIIIIFLSIELLLISAGRSSDALMRIRHILVDKFFK